MCAELCLADTGVTAVDCFPAFLGVLLLLAFLLLLSSLPAVAGILAVAGVLAVACVLAIASIPAYPDVPILTGVFTYCTVKCTLYNGTY